MRCQGSQRPRLVGLPAPLNAAPSATPKMAAAPAAPRHTQHGASPAPPPRLCHEWQRRPPMSAGAGGPAAQWASGVGGAAAGVPSCCRPGPQSGWGGGPGGGGDGDAAPRRHGPAARPGPAGGAASQRGARPGRGRGLGGRGLGGPRVGAGLEGPGLGGQGWRVPIFWGGLPGFGGAWFGGWGVPDFVGAELGVRAPGLGGGRAGGGDGGTRCCGVAGEAAAAAAKRLADVVPVSRVCVSLRPCLETFLCVVLGGVCTRAHGAVRRLPGWSASSLRDSLDVVPCLQEQASP